MIAATAAALAALILIEMPSAFETTNSYARYSNEQLQERNTFYCEVCQK